MAEQDDKAATSPIHGEQLKQILEAALLAAGQALSHAQLTALFNDEERPASSEISKALEQLEEDCANRGVELKKVASGYRLQVKQSLHDWVSRLWKERPQRYSRALLETMSLIAYRQPITRGEIEAVRGVSVSTSIIRTLQEREWIRVVGHRDVPGKPALFGTTKSFLDYFDLNNLDDLPTLAEIRDMENLEPELDLEPVFPDHDEDSQDEADRDEDSQDETDRDDGPVAVLEGDTDSSNENDQDHTNNKLETQNMTSPGVDYEVQDDQATVDDDLTVDDDSEESITK
jgi:segregation and condensation protein B